MAKHNSLSCEQEERSCRVTSPASLPTRALNCRALFLQSSCVGQMSGQVAVSPNQVCILLQGRLDQSIQLHPVSFMWCKEGARFANFLQGRICKYTIRPGNVLPAQIFPPQFAAVHAFSERPHKIFWRSPCIVQNGQTLAIGQLAIAHTMTDIH